jgi:kynureninase
MGTLTANLHVMMNTFYRPTPERYKLLCEGRAFPSDQVPLPTFVSLPHFLKRHICPKYAFASQVQLHGFKPEDAIIEMNPRQGEFTLREEDILEVIEKQGSSIALVIFSGVQYYTGQWFPMPSITKAAKAQVSFYPFIPASSRRLGKLVMSGQDSFHRPNTVGVFRFQSG